MTLRRGLEAPLVQPHDFVTLVPAREWWVASFNGRRGDADVDVYVDVTTAPVRSAGVVEAVDLDLDVVRLRDGSVRVLDEDEFADHQVRYRYPAEVIDRAQACCDDLVRRITRGRGAVRAGGRRPGWSGSPGRSGLSEVGRRSPSAAGAASSWLPP